MDNKTLSSAQQGTPSGRGLRQHAILRKIHEQDFSVYFLFDYRYRYTGCYPLAPP